MSCSPTSLTPTNSTNEIRTLINAERNESETIPIAARDSNQPGLDSKNKSSISSSTAILSTSHPSCLESVTNQALAIDRNNNNKNNSSSCSPCSHLLSKSLVTASIHSSSGSSFKRVSQHSTSSHSSEYDDNLEAFLETLTLNHIISEIKTSPLDGHELEFSEGNLN
jgi:hypothetical protein